MSLNSTDVGRPQFESFASSLLSSIAISPELSQRPFPHLSASIGGRNSPRSIMDVRPEMRPEMNGHRGGGPEAFGIDLDEGNGCKSAVEIVSRNAQKGAPLSRFIRPSCRLIEVGIAEQFLTTSIKMDTWLLNLLSSSLRIDWEKQLTGLS